MLVRVLRPQDQAWGQTIGLAVGGDTSALQISGELGRAGLLWDPPLASGPIAQRTDHILAGLRLQPYQLLFLSERVTRVNLARPEWWRRNAAAFLGDRPVHEATRPRQEHLVHAVAVGFDVPELWQRLVAVPDGFGVGNVIYVPDEFDVPSLLENLLEQRHLDPHHFAVRGHFETTVAEVVPAGGLVLRVWAQDEAQVDLIGTTDAIKDLADSAAL